MTIKPSNLAPPPPPPKKPYTTARAKFLKLHPPIFCGLTPFLLWHLPIFMAFSSHFSLICPSTCIWLTILPTLRFLWKISFSLLVFLCRRLPNIYYRSRPFYHALCILMYVFTAFWSSPLDVSRYTSTLNSAQPKLKAYIWLCYVKQRHPYVHPKTHPWLILPSPDPTSHPYSMDYQALIISSPMLPV